MHLISKHLEVVFYTKVYIPKVNIFHSVRYLALTMCCDAVVTYEIEGLRTRVYQLQKSSFREFDA